MADTKEITIKVYGKDGQVTKTSSAKPLDLRFGSIRRVMEVLKIEDTKNTYEMLRTVYEVWDELTEILGECFPDITREEWDSVKVNELIPAIIRIVKASFDAMLQIPTEKNE
jgi:hypothetical protein